MFVLNVIILGLLYTCTEEGRSNSCVRIVVYFITQYLVTFILLLHSTNVPTNTKILIGNLFNTPNYGHPITNM